MNKPEYFSAVDPQNIDTNAFTVSLLVESGMQEQQAALLTELSQIILKYTHGESTSVPVETAESLMESMLYAMDNYLKSLNSIPLALKQLRDIPALRKRSLKYLDDQIAQAKELYAQVKATRIRIPLQCYNDTIDTGLKEFFQYYDPAFSAHETVASIDYPISIDGCGILFIKDYLQTLLAENILCARRSPAQIWRVFQKHGAQYHIPPQELYENISELMDLYGL